MTITAEDIEEILRDSEENWECDAKDIEWFFILNDDYRCVGTIDFPDICKNYCRVVTDKNRHGIVFYDQIQSISNVYKNPEEKDSKE